MSVLPPPRPPKRHPGFVDMAKSLEQISREAPTLYREICGLFRRAAISDGLLAESYLERARLLLLEHLSRDKATT